MKRGRGSTPDVDQQRVIHLTQWFKKNARDLPWRRSQHRHGYGAFVSEVMLQQTQVARVVDRFQEFMQTFPTVHELAEADEQAVLKMWQGLGYYRRARNLHAAARMIVAEFGGNVPDDVESLQRLPGVGRYTAGAIASIAFGQPAPIVDGNVQRVLARWDAKADTVDGLKDWFWSRAESLAAKSNMPGVFNEALMELGATVCTPRSPCCQSCPVPAWCEAKRLDKVVVIPRPKEAAKPTTVHHHAVLIRRGNKILFEKRGPKNMWSGMWQVPTVESQSRRTARFLIKELPVAVDSAPKPVGRFEHLTTHRRIHFHVFSATSRARRGEWRLINDVQDLPMSNAQRRVLRDFGEAAVKPLVGNGECI